jgi:hypothetical protein
VSRYDANILKSFSNLGNVMTEEVRSLNVVDILSKKYLIIENPEAIVRDVASTYKVLKINVWLFLTQRKYREKGGYPPCEGD